MMLWFLRLFPQFQMIERDLYKERLDNEQTHKQRDFFIDQHRQVLVERDQVRADLTAVKLELETLQRGMTNQPTARAPLRIVARNWSTVQRALEQSEDLE